MDLSVELWYKGPPRSLGLWQVRTPRADASIHTPRFPVFSAQALLGRDLLGDWHHVRATSVGTEDSSSFLCSPFPFSPSLLIFIAICKHGVLKRLAFTPTE